MLRALRQRDHAQTARLDSEQSAPNALRGRLTAKQTPTEDLGDGRNVSQMPQ